MERDVAEVDLPEVRGDDGPGDRARDGVVAAGPDRTDEIGPGRAADHVDHGVEAVFRGRVRAAERGGGPGGAHSIGLVRGGLAGDVCTEVGGELEKAFEEADVIVESDYKTPITWHCHMENHSAYAYMDDMEHIVVVSSTQIPHICRRIVGEALDIPWGRVRVVKPYIGGGFGNKQDVILEPMVAFLTMKLGGVPVKLELPREECFIGTRTRHSTRTRNRAAATRDGVLKGLDIECVSNTGAYASHGHAIMGAACSKSCNLYPRSVIKVKATTHYANIPAAGAMRAYGSPQVIFGIECIVEEAARAIGRITLPSTLASELAVNPFLRTREAAVVAAARAREPGVEPGVEPGAETLAGIRA